MWTRLQQVAARLADYPLWEVGVELVALWLLVFIVFRFVRGTRAAGALKGLLILLIGATLLIRVLPVGQWFPRLSILHENLLGFVAIALVVTFQPELRRALIHIGERSIFWGQTASARPVVDAIVQSASFLSKNKFGAIMAIERQVGLRESIETGRLLNADVSSHLLNAIFWPNNPLHDMGVVIRNDKIVAAGVQFPLAEPGELRDAQLGTRHRAAVGMARASDALVVVVSEETGAISIAEGTRLDRWLTPESLKSELLKRLAQRPGGVPHGEPAPESDPADFADASPPAPIRPAGPTIAPLTPSAAIKPGGVAGGPAGA